MKCKKVGVVVFCNKCGSEINDASKFCRVCGAERKTEKRMIKREAAITRNVPKFWGAGIVVVAIIVLLVCKNQLLCEKGEANIVKASIFAVRLGEQIKIDLQEELTLEEQVQFAFLLNDKGKIERAEELVGKLIKVNGDSYEIYIMISNQFLNRNEIEKAKECLLLGFEQTESVKVMEEYLDVSMKYASDGDNEIYKTILKFGELYASITDKEELLELAKEIYMYIQIMTQ